MSDSDSWTNTCNRMLPQRNGLSLQSPLRPLSVLFFYLLLTHSVTGQSQLISPFQPIVATVGDDIILPCHLEPAVDVAAKTFEWTRSDLDTELFVWRAGQDLVHKHPSYEGRISPFTAELQRGNISLKLSKVKPSDGGRYRCFIPHKEIVAHGSFVELVVGAVSSPVISLAGIDRDKAGVVLQCECAGWYPEPEVLWLDGEGKLLSAGPTETVRGPDDLYTVSSRVTVEKRHSNSFTCRVQQRNINQTRETHIQVPDDFFQVQSTHSSVTTGLAVGLAVCVLIIVLLLFVVWKWRQNIIKTTRGHGEEEIQPFKGKGKEESKQLQQEQQRRQEAEREVQTLKEELQTKKTEFESKLAEVQQQQQSLKEELETKTRELEENKAAQSKSSFNWTITTKQTLENEQQRRKEAEKQVQDLKQKLNDKSKELQEEQRRREEAEKRVKTLEEELQTKENEAQMLHVLHAETQNTRLSGKLSLKFKKQKHKQHLQQQQSKEEAEKEVQTSKDSGVVDEIKDNQAEVQQLQDESQTTENNQPTMNQKPENIRHSTAGDDNQHLHSNDQDHNLTSPANQDSAKSHITVDEVDVHGKHVRLSNNSKEDQPMGDWELHIRVNNRKPMEYHFKPSFILKAGNTVTIWAHGQGVWFAGSTDLVWSSQKPWGTGKQLLVTVYSNTGEVEASKMLERGSSQTYQEKIICMTSQDSATGPITVDEVDLKGEYVRLTNTSNKAQELKDWELHIQVNNRKPIVYKFSSSFILVAGKTVTIWSSDYSGRNDPPNDLVWQNQKSWGTGEELLATLYNNTGEEMATKLKTPNISDG